jgi:hypothetical protein
MEGRRYPRLGDGEWLRRRYLDDEASLDDIATELGCQKSNFRQALVAAGVPTRRPGRRRRLRALREEELLELIRRRGQGAQQMSSASTPRPSTATFGDSESSSRPRQQAEHTVETREPIANRRLPAGSFAI